MALELEELKSLVTVDYSEFLVDQIQAAEDARKAIRELKESEILKPSDESHRAILETDVFQLRRGLCLPCAASTAINLVLGYRLIGDTSGALTIGDYFRILLPHHGSNPTPENPKGWLVTTPRGDMYHHAVITFARGLEIPAYSYQGFSNVSEFHPILKNGGSVAISLDNHFVIEQTLAPYPRTVEIIDNTPHIKVATESGPTFRPFQNGRHVVTLLNIENNEVQIADSFNLPQTETHGLTVTTSTTTLNKYLQYFDRSTTRAIVFLPPGANLPPSIHPTPVYIPEQISQAVTKEISQRLLG